jgi:hypothetical protein
MSIDLSTQTFCELTASNLKSNLDNVIRTWRSIGVIVRNQLASGRGIRLDSLGSFSFTVKGLLYKL